MLGKSGVSLLFFPTTRYNKILDPIPEGCANNILSDVPFIQVYKYCRVSRPGAAAGDHRQ